MANLENLLQAIHEVAWQTSLAEMEIGYIKSSYGDSGSRGNQQMLNYEQLILDYRREGARLKRIYAERQQIIAKEENK